MTCRNMRGSPVETRTAAQLTQELAENYGKLIFHIIYALTNHWQESEDLTQDTFLRAFRGIDAARAASGSQFQAKAWLVQIAINTVRMHRRRQRAVRFFSFSAFQVEQDAVDCKEEVPAAAYEEMQETGDLETIIAERDAVHRCIEQLPEGLRIPLLLSIVAGFSSKELASMLNLNEAAVRQRLARARKAFQRLYAWESGEHIHTGNAAPRSRSHLSRSRGHLRHRSTALVPAVL